MPELSYGPEYFLMTGLEDAVRNSDRPIRTPTPELCTIHRSHTTAAEDDAHLPAEHHLAIASNSKVVEQGVA